jgi:hypothetical protein
MTALPTTHTAADAWTARERQEAARNAYLASVEAGTPLTGARLGRQFGRTDRWGRLQIRKFRAELDTGDAGGTDPGVSAVRNLDGTADRTVSARLDGQASPLAPVRNDAGTTAAVDRKHTVVPFMVSSGAAKAGMPGGNALGTRPEPADAGAPVPPGTLEPPERPAAAAVSDAVRADAGRSWLDSLVTLTVAVVCAAASFGHMYHVASLAGEPVWIARAWPITVDGLVIAALRRGHAGRWWLALGIAVSMAANVLAQYPELAASAGPFVSAWPPVALYGTHRLLHGARRASAGTPVP